MPWVGIGGTLLFLSGCLYLLNLLLTVTRSRRTAVAVPAFAESAASADDAPAILARVRPWVVVAIVLLVVAYGPTLTRLIVTSRLNVPGLRVW